MDDAPTSSPVFGVGLSARADPWDAAEAAAAAAAERIEGRPASLAIVFACGAHAGHAAGVAESAARTAAPGCLIGCTCSGVLAGTNEVEDGAAVAVMLAHLPGVTLTPVWSNDWPAALDPDATDDDWRAHLGDNGAGAHRGTLLLADPFSVPAVSLLNRLGVAVGPPEADDPAPPIVGGLASFAHAAGGNRLFLDDRVVDSGVVGVGFSGAIELHGLVSQGCQPVGPAFVVTRAKGNIVFELGGRPAVERAREVVGELEDPAAALAGGGLLLGRAVTEYRERFGRDDFLIRGIVGAEESSGFIALSDAVPAGRTVRFFVRDRTTAAEDLGLLLDAHALHGPPAGVLAFSCVERGRRLFSEIGHDARAVQRAFGAAVPGPELAKPGDAELDVAPPVPLAGMFAAGEIGSLHGRPFLHTHTASMAVFRARTSDKDTT